MKIVIGIILIIIGFMLVWKNEAVVGFTGYSAWAESKLGTMGGTRLMYKLIGLALIFGGLLAITNLHQGFLEGTIGKLLSPGI
ncbi:hypothetical protein CL632_01240 [bacterium]|nr:hypothetical protein [bacterium]MDP6756507.1 hypothetical protein [Patescibacteria group bacterium]|tara:strand:+ start:116 stop:364 length:249 start_codon:yes stop_codon:yes gene_type:complete